MADIAKVWEKIKKLEGEEFHTKRGLSFTYRIAGNEFHPSRTEWLITRADFERALEYVPCDGPGVISNLIQGPSYVWAVLHDPRIRS